jgi:hypothetical protein
MFPPRHRRAPILRLVFHAHLPAFALLVLLLCFAPFAFAANKSAPPAKLATEYPAHDTHTDEQVTVAADPCLQPKDCPFFRVPYLEHGFLPVRVIFTNDSDKAISLDDARIQFLSGDNGKIQAATDDDLNRRIFTLHSTQAIHVPLDPFPIHRTPVDKKITDDENEFGFAGTTVNPHSTLAGYLFYDIQGMDQPLKGAQLYVKMVHTLDGKKDLFAFSVPFDKWLAANPDAAHPTR